MIYVVDLIDKSDLHTLNNFYNFVNFVDGKNSGSSDREIKYNMSVSDEVHYETMVNILNEALYKHPYFNYAFMPNRHTNPLFLKYETDMHYACHNDHPMMNGIRTDYSVTCFLNDPSEYEGGELVLYCGDAEVEYKLPAGKAVIYPTGLLHKVCKVKSGTRRVAVWWFESVITNPDMRNIIVDYNILLNKNCKELRQDTIKIETLESFESIRYRLIRHYGSFY